MQTLHFPSPITNLSSHMEKFIVSTQSGEIFIVDSNKTAIENQYTLPSQDSTNVSAIYSRDGDFIWALAGGSVYFTKPSPGSTFTKVELDSNAISIYPHTDGISVIAYLETREIAILRPVEVQGANLRYGPLPPDSRFVGVAHFENKVAVVIDGVAPAILVLSGSPLDLYRRIEVSPRTAVISFAASADNGILLFWADGIWTIFKDSSTISGRAMSAKSIDVVNNRLAAANGENVFIYDLKFDAELEKCDIPADRVLLFANRIAAATSEDIRFREWRGMSSTTTRSLILAAKNHKESNPKTTEKEVILNEKGMKVSLRAPKSQAKGPRQVVQEVIDDRAVPHASREKALKKAIDDTSEDRDLAIFHLTTDITMDMVMEALDQGRLKSVLLMLKKLEPQSSENIGNFIKRLLTSLPENEVVLSHFLTQPHEEDKVSEAVTMLTAEEADALLYFLSRLLKERRMWRELEVSLSVIDEVIHWSSVIITKHQTDLAVRHLTNGLNALREELTEELQRIDDAGNCWAIVANITEGKKGALPPNFMYIVEHIDIPE